jgi:hypothetical protein
MYWERKSRKAVFILGAGATRGAVPHVVINRKRVKAPLNGDFFNVVETFARASGSDGGMNTRYRRLRKTLQNDFSTRGKWPLPMETAFSLLYVSKDFPEIYARGAGRRRKAGSRTEIEDFLRLTFGVLGAIEIGASEHSLYSKLVDRLESSDTIITLNYDTLLDGALIRSGWPPGGGYCLIGGQNKLKWKIQGPPLSSRLSGVKLLKLHGSLNWLVRGSYKNIHRVFDAKPNQVLIYKTPNKNEKKNFLRQIIPPIYGKFFNHIHWRKLWDRAYREIITAQVIVVIGCSLVDTDFHLSGMFGRAISERKRQGHKFASAILVDRNLKVRRKWERLLKGNVARTVGYRSFAQFADALRKVGGTDESG